LIKNIMLELNVLIINMLEKRRWVCVMKNKSH
jgi:hypothetical protein